MDRNTYEIYEVDIETGKELVKVRGVKYLSDASKIRDSYSTKKKKTKRYYFREEV